MKEIFKTKAQKLAKKLNAHANLKVEQKSDHDWDILDPLSVLENKDGYYHECVGKIKEIKGQNEAELYVYSDKLEHVLVYLSLDDLYIRK